jgi:hypothetical protein
MGAVRELFARIALKLGGGHEAMDRIIEQWGNTGDLLHAVLEGLVIAEISDASLPQKLLKPATESRRGLGFRSLRSSRIGVSGRLRAGR